MKSVERLTAERDRTVGGSIPRAVSIPRVLKKLRNDGSSIALQRQDLCVVARIDVQVKYPQLCPYLVRD